MAINKFAATALLAIGATGITAGAVNAGPTVVHTDVRLVASDGMRGADQGVPSTTSLDPDTSSISTTLDAGRFALSEDRKVVTLLNEAGAEAASLPMAVQFAGSKFLLDPRIDESGRTLTLTPIGAPALTPDMKNQASLQFVDAASDLQRHQYNAGVGALIGLGIGILLGLPFAVVGAIPGGVIGAAIGALIGWTLP